MDGMVRWAAVSLAAVMGLSGCASSDEAPGSEAAADPGSSTTPGEPVDAGDDSAVTEDEPAATSESEAVVLSGTRWVALPNSTGTISVQLFTIIENVSDLVQEVRVEAEMLDASGDVVGQSGPQPFLEAIGPGDRLPVRVGGQTGAEPADVVPRMRSSELADFEQERYGAVRLTGQVLDFGIGDDTIVVQAEITNTGEEAPIGVATYYLAAFDDQDALVAADPGFVLEPLDPGSSTTVEAEMGWRPDAGDSVERVEIFFVAVSS